VQHDSGFQKIYRRIDDIIDLSHNLNDNDLLKQSIAAHICVLQSGLLENLVKESLIIYTNKRAQPNVTRFVSKRIADLQNPKPDKIENILSEFSVDLMRDLDNFWRDNGIRDHVSSVVSNRHLIAHGQNYQVSISRVSDWHRSIGKLIRFFEDRFISQPPPSPQ
jgi:hypothetical protein